MASSPSPMVSCRQGTSGPFSVTGRGGDGLIPVIPWIHAGKGPAVPSPLTRRSLRRRGITKPGRNLHRDRWLLPKTSDEPSQNKWQ